MKFPWRLINRLVCLHCWAISRYYREPIREAFHCARRCATERDRREAG